MDKDLLVEKGLHPRNSRHACLQDYQLKIGERATLAPGEGACAYGTIMELDSDELRDLYGSGGVEDYLPHTVQAHLMDGTPIKAITYILPLEKTMGSNSEYAIKLAAVARKLDLPGGYIEEIESWI